MTFDIQAPYRPFTPHVNQLTPTTGTVTLDMSRIDQRHMTLPVSGDITFESDNISPGRTLFLKLTADSSDRSLTFPDWIFVTGDVPTDLLIGEVAWLEVRWFDTTDETAVAIWYAVSTLI